MAEAEELISDAARHATVFVQDLWRRHRSSKEPHPNLRLSDLTPRIDLFLEAVFGSTFQLRPAQPPAPTTLLEIVIRHHHKPRLHQAVPATDGQNIWLPQNTGTSQFDTAIALYRTMALQNAMRAIRGSARHIADTDDALLADVYLLLEACAADKMLAELLPGAKPGIHHLRRHALACRPELTQFPKHRQPLELWVRKILAATVDETAEQHFHADSPAQSLENAARVIHNLKLLPKGIKVRQLGPAPLLRDWWTGDLRAPSKYEAATAAPNPEGWQDSAETPKSAHLTRTPEVRDAKPDEDEEQEHQSPWMIQIDEPHPHAEDPAGIQRPADRDEDTDADQYGDMLSDLNEARLVSTPGTPKEVLLSEDPPDVRARRELKAAIANNQGISYPEWDYRSQSYKEPGATVHQLTAITGSQRWVDDTLQIHASMLNNIRRRFEMLRAQRVWHRKQSEGDDIDLDAYINSYADFRAGCSLTENLYQTRRTADRNMAISLLIDNSGSTDSWVAANRRIIDVEREALLLVSIALEGMGEPYAVQAFSGEGPQAVTMREIKGFNEHFSNDIALRISALEPEHYTRAGAAIRHATAGLMQQPAQHRLLLLLSDGKPNDKDDYEGRYGVEDMRQAIKEARLQGISPFCLTIDRQAANYLPRIFGAHHYALLPNPERLPFVLLDWMKRLVIS